MNPASKTLLFAVLLIAGATGVFFLMQGGDAPPPAFGPKEEITRLAEPAVGIAPVTAERHAEEAPPPAVREEIDGSRAATESAQGARGRLVDPSGNPLADTKVYLMEGGGTDLFRQLMLANKGAIIPPVARADTDRQGNFALGLARPDATKRYEIRVVSDVFVDKQVPNVHIAEGQWYDAGTIVLDRGTTLYGRVTIEGSGGLPVPDARVTVKPLNFGMPTVSPTPGREDGLIAEVDHTGSYRFVNAPSGMVTVSAVAPGYAKVEKTNVKVEENGDNQVVFELPPGVSIAGIVTDAGGKAIDNVKIEVTSISSKQPIHTVTRSDSNGNFEAIGLVNGQYMLTAVAPGFVKVPIKPIQAGDKSLHVVLEKQGSARIRVFDKNNRLMTRYRVTVKRYFAAQDQIANLDIPPQQARPDRDGVFTVEGLNPDSYVFQVEANAHAKAFSDPFRVALGDEAPLVEVRMNEGGIIEGVVVDTTRRPLSGVKVETLPNHIDDNPFTKMFRGMIPFKVTEQSTTTNDQGFYRFKLLNPGTYQLKFTHPEHYDVSMKDNEVQVGQVTAIEAVRMQRGTVVTGTARVDGKPASQVKVTITALSEAKVQSGTLFNCDAITGNDGSFQFDKRVPPGRYQVMAARQTLANPLLQIADFHKTKQEIVLGAGQAQYNLTINIVSESVPGGR